MQTLKLLWKALNWILKFLFRTFKPTYITKDGYVRYKETDEYEHRMYARKVLQRSLYPNEVVHHINGKRIDNRIQNLCVMDRHEHELFHAWLDWKRKKTGAYPRFSEQKAILKDKHAGILLEEYHQYRPYNEKFKFYHQAKTPNYSRQLYFNLKRERNRLAQQNRIPPYLVFKNFTLIEMAQQKPHNLQAMRQITGVSEEKLRLYGDQLLQVISKHKANPPLLTKKSSVS